jgi:hypothetical protein
VGDEAQLRELVPVALERATNIVEHAHGSTAIYRDPSGATLTVHREGDEILKCVKPGFEGQARARWRPLGVVPDRDCRFCDLVYAELLGDEDDEPFYPFALEVETMGAERELIPYGEAGEVRFAGLWEEGEVWPDEDAFREAQEAEWADVTPPPELDLPALRGFASRSLVPSGTFATDGEMTSHVLAHGIVESVDERRNELGGAAFRLVRLHTLGGVFDTCLAPGSVEREELLAPGALARATLWLVGRPLTLREEPRPAPLLKEGRRRGLFRRLFARRQG